MAPAACSGGHRRMGTHRGHHVGVRGQRVPRAASGSAAAPCGGLAGALRGARAGRSALEDPHSYRLGCRASLRLTRRRDHRRRPHLGRASPPRPHLPAPRRPPPRPHRHGLRRTPRVATGGVVVFGSSMCASRRGRRA
jgi:hypothetical protein